MNEIVLRGYLRDIQYSHHQGDIEYEKANIICPRVGEREEDIISLRYKKFVNKNKEGDFVELKGNLRSYSSKNEDGTNNVEIYVFTYFDQPEEITRHNTKIDGRICKMNNISSYNGRLCLHFILANNIFTNNGMKTNSYIPCTCYGDIAEQLAQLDVNDFITIEGDFCSHTYKKQLEDGTVEYRVAHEVLISSYEQRIY